MFLGLEALLLGLKNVSIKIRYMHSTLTSLCQVSVWYDNIVPIIIVDFAVLGI
jgi:hypothetical protein